MGSIIICAAKAKNNRVQCLSYSRNINNQLQWNHYPIIQIKKSIKVIILTILNIIIIKYGILSYNIKQGCKWFMHHNYPVGNI